MNDYQNSYELVQLFDKLAEEYEKWNNLLEGNDNNRSHFIKNCLQDLQDVNETRYHSIRYLITLNSQQLTSLFRLLNIQYNPNDLAYVAEITPIREIFQKKAPREFISADVKKFKQFCAEISMVNYIVWFDFNQCLQNSTFSSTSLINTHTRPYLKKLLIEPEDPQALNDFIRSHYGYYYFSMGLSLSAYLSSLSFLVAEFVMRSEGIALVLQAFHINSSIHTKATLGTNIFFSLLMVIANITFSPSQETKNVMRKYQKSNQNGWKGYINALFLEQAKKNKVLFLAFLVMSISSAMISIVSIDTLIKPYVSAKAYANIYPVASLFLVFFGILYSFFYYYDDIMNKTWVGLKDMQKMLKASIYGNETERAIAQVASFHAVIAILMRTFKMAYGLFNFMKNLNTSYEMCLLGGLIGGIATLIASASRVPSLDAVFYSRATKEAGYIAKECYQQLALNKVCLELLKDPSIIIIASAGYLIFNLLSPIFVGLSLALYVMNELRKIFLPAARQKMINTMAITQETQEHKKPHQLISFTASASCAFYQFSNAVTFIYMVEAFFPTVFDVKTKQGCLAIIAILALVSYLSYSSYLYQQSKVDEVLGNMAKSVVSIPEKIKKTNWATFFCCKDNQVNRVGERLSLRESFM